MRHDAAVLKHLKKQKNKRHLPLLVHRRNVVSMGTKVVETTDKQCEVKQKEEYEDDGVKVGLVLCGTRRCKTPGAHRDALVGNA